MADVFISYHKDSAWEVVERIASDLEKNQITCWYAHRDCEGNYAEAIERAIEESSIFLFVLNRGSDASPECDSEVHLAHEKYKNGNLDHLIVLRIEECWPTKGMRYYLEKSHIVDGRLLRENISYLVTRIAQKLGRKLSSLEKGNKKAKQDSLSANVLYNPENDLNETVRLAEENDPKAMYEAGLMYYYGIGNESGRDYKKAYHWLKKALESNSDYSDKAKVFISRMYYNGLVPGESQSFEKSFSLNMSVDKEKYLNMVFDHVIFMMINGLGCMYSAAEINSFIHENSVIMVTIQIPPIC